MPSHPDRSLRLSGASNFRDLGGYSGLDGRAVRWRRLFRSDHLAALTPGDARVLQSLGVSRVLDLRGVTESAAAPGQLPGARQIALPIEPTIVQRMKDLLDAGQQITPARTVELMRQTYRAFVHDNTPRFAALFEHLLASDEPLVFHCTAGKDRTGFAAALILRALGVPQPVVMQDYLLTNDLYTMPSFNDRRAPVESLKVLWRVQEAFLDAALQAIEQDFDSLDNYLERALRLTPAARQRLAALYLQAA
ncbi:MAG: tyrosine-protein phosphatase [Burkholderiaceae bacterium]|jgi:protein-tyrosine phosphatase|nr:tyrosine-protein phosphatase [Burkholderiaceae bacterium]